MNRFFLVILIMIFPVIAMASSCATTTEISHMENTTKKFELCISYKKTKKCESPKTIIVHPKQSVKVLFRFMCGYSADLSIDKYWLMYREVGQLKYSVIKYSEKGIIF